MINKVEFLEKGDDTITDRFCINEIICYGKENYFVDSEGSTVEDFASCFFAISFAI